MTKIKVTDKSNPVQVKIRNTSLTKSDISKLYMLLYKYSIEKAKYQESEWLNDAMMIQLNLQKMYMERYNEYLDC